MDEQWKVSLNNPHYEVSNLGNIRRLSRKVRSRHGYRLLPMMPIKKHITASGYYKVGMNHKNILVHRAVAITWIPNPENKREINHKNGIRTDNRIENLEWVTSSENKVHAYANGINKNYKAVEMYSLDGVLLRTYKMVKDVADDGFNKTKVAACCRLERKTHKGFMWKFCV